MLVEGGKRKKGKKSKKKGRNAESLAKEALKFAIANGTINDLLWGETMHPERDESESSEEEDMEDHSVEVFNELLLRKSSVMNHPESELLTKHRQSVLMNKAQMTFLTVPEDSESHLESQYESVPPPLHTKGSVVEPSPRLKQSKLLSPNVSSKKQHASPGKPHSTDTTHSVHASNTAVPSTSTPHATPHSTPHTTHHKHHHSHHTHYSREEDQDFREILTSSLDIKHKSKAFTDIMRNLKVATLEPRRGSNYGTERVERRGSDEYMTAQEELNIVQDNDVLWGGVAGTSRKSRYTPPVTTRSEKNSNAVNMLELVQISHDLRREREMSVSRGGSGNCGGGKGTSNGTSNGTDGDVGGVGNEYRGSSRVGGAGFEGSERYMNYTGSNERLDRMKLQYDDSAELNHKAKVEARYAAHMNATLQLKSHAAQHIVHTLPPHVHFGMFYRTMCSENNKHSGSVYDVFTAPIVKPTRPNNVPGDDMYGGINSDVSIPEPKHYNTPVAKSKHHGHSPPRTSPHIHHKALYTDSAHHTIPHSNTTPPSTTTAQNTTHNTTHNTTYSTHTTPLRNTTVTDEYIRNIRNAYLSNTIESSSDSEHSVNSTQSVRTNNSTGNNNSAKNLTLAVPDSDNDSVSIYLASPTGYNSSIAEDSDVHTPKSEKHKRTPKQKRGKRLPKAHNNSSNSDNNGSGYTNTPPRSAGRALRGNNNTTNNTTNTTDNDTSTDNANGTNTTGPSTNANAISSANAHTSSPSSRTSVRKSIAVRPSRVSKYTPRAPTIPTTHTTHSTDTTHTSHISQAVSGETGADAGIGPTHHAHGGIVFTDSSDVVVETSATVEPTTHTTTTNTASENTNIPRVPTAPEMIHNALPAHSLHPNIHTAQTTTNNTTHTTQTAHTTPKRSHKARKHASPSGNRSKPSSPHTLHTAFDDSEVDVNTLCSEQSLPTTPHTPIYSTISGSPTNTTTYQSHTNNYYITDTNTTASNTTNTTNTTVPPPSHYPQYTSKPPAQNVRTKPSPAAPVRARSFRTSDTSGSVYNTNSGSRGGNSRDRGTNNSRGVNLLYKQEMSDSWDEVIDAKERFLQPEDNNTVNTDNMTSGGYNNVVVDTISGNIEYNNEFEEEFKDGYSVKWSNNSASSKLNEMYGSSSDKYNSGSMKYHSPTLSPLAPEYDVFIPIESDNTNTSDSNTEHTPRHSPPMVPSHANTHTTDTHTTDTNPTLNPTTHTTIHPNTNTNTNNTLPTGLEHLTGIWPYDPSISAYTYIQALYNARRAAAQTQKEEYVRLQRSERERRRVKQPRQLYPIKHAISETYQVLTFDPEHLHLVLTTHSTSNSTSNAPLHSIQIPLHTTYITENTSSNTITLRTTCSNIPNGYLATYSVSVWLTMQSEINSALSSYELSRYKLQGKEVEVVIEGDGDIDSHSAMANHTVKNSENMDNGSHRPALRFDDEGVDSGVFLTSVAPLAYNNGSVTAVSMNSTSGNNGGAGSVSSTDSTHHNRVRSISPFNASVYGIGSSVYSNCTSPTNLNNSSEVSIDQLIHYAEQGYASFLTLLHDSQPQVPLPTIDIQPSSHRPVCVPIVYGGKSGPVRPLLLTQRFTTLTNTANTANSSNINTTNTTRKHTNTTQPPRFMSLIKDAVSAWKAAVLEQKRIAQLTTLPAPPTTHSPSVPHIHKHINDETKRNFKFYDPHSSGIIYNNDGYIAEGSVVGGGLVQLGIKGHVYSNGSVGGSVGNSISGSVCLPTIPRVPKQHSVSVRSRGGVEGSDNSISSQVTNTSVIYNTPNDYNTNTAIISTSAKSNAVVVPTVSAKINQAYTNNNDSARNKNTAAPGITDSISGEEGECPVLPLQLVLLVDSRPDIQVHFAELFLQLDMVVDVYSTLREACEAVRENASLYGWVLLNYVDLCAVGVEPALRMLCSAAGSVGSSMDGVGGVNSDVIGTSGESGTVVGRNGRGVDGRIVFDDESVYMDNATTTSHKMVVYNAAHATDNDVMVLQQMGVDGILNEPYTLEGLKDCCI